MSADESVRRFCDSIGIKGGAVKVPEPTAAPASAAPVTPAPVKLPLGPLPPAKPDKNNFAKRADDELEAQVEVERHPELFDDSPGGWANFERVLGFIKKHHDSYPSRATVSDAISTLRRSGDLIPLKPEPSAFEGVKAPPAKTVPIESLVPPPDPVDELPPLSSWLWEKLGSNKLLTRQDVKAIPDSLYSELYRSNRYGHEFQKRVNAILNK